MNCCRLLVEAEHFENEEMRPRPQTEESMRQDSFRMATEHTASLAARLDLETFFGACSEAA